MKKQFKYVLLLTLILLIGLQLVSAMNLQHPSIEQSVPYESSPTTHLENKGGAWETENPTNAYDQNYKELSAGVYLGDSVTSDKIGLTVRLFTKPTPEPFTPTWVDLKIKYSCVGSTDDLYQIRYRVLPSATWTILEAWTTKVQPLSLETIARTWHNIPEPNDGVWSWTDVGNLFVQFDTRMVGSDDGVKLYIYEVWASVYPDPLPPTSSTTLSVWPQVILGTRTGNTCFVDIYAADVTALAGFEFSMSYDKDVLTPILGESWVYSPWDGPGWITLDDTAGLISIAKAIHLDHPDLDIGFTGSSPVARIYFKVDKGGGSALEFTFTKLVDPTAAEISHTSYDGWIGTPIILSYQGSLLPPGDPTGSTWHEIVPVFCQTYTLTGWTDNGDGDLTVSDQVVMTDAVGGAKEYHVDQVTVTIHWTYKAPDTGEGAAEPTTPLNELPGGDPTEWPITWHQIYPPEHYCKTFEITSWEDTNGDFEFTPSDQFDFTYTGPADVVLAGPEPAAGEFLSWPGANDLYYDADYSGTWDVGEPAIRDVDGDYMFWSEATGGMDIVLVGPTPMDFEPLSFPGGNDMYYDADYSGTWDVGEPAIRDADGDTTYSPAETHWAHLDDITTDIWISEKPPPPTVAEFPLGVGLLTLIVPIVPIVYIWRLRKKNR